MKVPSRHTRSRAAAFTLIELLVSTAVIGLLVVILVGITSQVSQTWRYTTNKVEEFQEARDGFEAMTRRLSQATLETYLDQQTKLIMVTDGSNTVPISFPIRYFRQSELRFVSSPISSGTNPSLINMGPQVQNSSPGVWQTTHGVFFQAPLGMVSDTTDLSANSSLLNTWGYFVEIGPDTNRPAFLGGNSDIPVPRRFRSRLMEIMQPAESNSIYDMAPPANANFTLGSQGMTWITLLLPPSQTRPARVLSENILALIILPKLSPQDQSARQAAGLTTLLSPWYQYDSWIGVLPTDPAGTQFSGNPGTGASGVNDNDINPGSQLPPVVEVAMVAIDEQSAQRLASRYNFGNSNYDGTFGGLNTLTNGGTQIFTNAAQLETSPSPNGLSDLAFYEQVLTGGSAQTPDGQPNPVHNLHLNYRIFTTNVTIRGAKWSKTHTH